MKSRSGMKNAVINRSTAIPSHTVQVAIAGLHQVAHGTRRPTIFEAVKLR